MSELIESMRVGVAVNEWERDRLSRGYETASSALLSEATAEGPWTGELSSSPLSTATAIVALQLVARDRPQRMSEFESLIARGLEWLVECQNGDGGWGDTILSLSNISTTTLVYSCFHLAESTERFGSTAERARRYIDTQGGFEAIKRRYGKDHTFSVPILTQCALAGLISWDQLPPLPFELGVFPHWFYKWMSLPVVSYALPALIAIGQVRHHLAPSRNPIVRAIRQAAVTPTLCRLKTLQPESGGFLEATPLTSFVTMSLAAMGQSDHPVARRGVDFLIASVRPDGSWPIDTNLATWVTTLSVNALRPGSLPAPQASSISTWLLKQQNRVVHPYTNAAPGGWAWTDLSGGVPDADDTPGAILALLKLDRMHPGKRSPDLAASLRAGVQWLLDLQNRDGGWPTFCRGWGALPFDRSAPDLTAHAIRAIHAWRQWCRDQLPATTVPDPLFGRVERAIGAGFSFLKKTQRADGTWLPLWFGNQHAADEENPVYGVSRVVAAFRDTHQLSDPQCQSACDWLANAQNSDGGWGGTRQTPSSVEETALAVEALLAIEKYARHCQRGLEWLLARVETEAFRQPAPIGLYFAKLWYFERLYPIIFVVSALGQAVDRSKQRSVEQSHADSDEHAATIPTGMGMQT